MPIPLFSGSGTWPQPTPSSGSTRPEAQNTKLDAQSAQLASIRWIMGIGFTLLALLINLLRFLD